MRTTSIRHRFAEHSGVYSFTNVITGRVYIGSTATTFRRRWVRHLLDLKKGTHTCGALQDDWKVYRPEDFVFDVVELTRNIDARQREELHIERLRSEGATLYNQKRAFMHRHDAPLRSDDELSAGLDIRFPDPL